ncbi:hypothetical protein [Chroococcidiopsis sp. SAG 2025]|nr:hypothetical protein [Chroococcidiopsis sp. SAG 2025]
MQKWKSRAEKDEREITCRESTDYGNIELLAQTAEYAQFDPSA